MPTPTASQAAALQGVLSQFQANNPQQQAALAQVQSQFSNPTPAQVQYSAAGNTGAVTNAGATYTPAPAPPGPGTGLGTTLQGQAIAAKDANGGVYTADPQWGGYRYSDNTTSNKWVASLPDGVQTTGSSTPADTSTNTPDSTGNQYLQNYLSSMQPSVQEKGYQSQLDALTSQEAGVNASRDLGIQGVSEQPIATPFITGQSAAITNRAATQMGALSAQAVPIQQQLARAQAVRQSAMDMSKAALDYATTQSKNAYQTVSPGATLYNTQTQSPAYTAPAAPTTLAAGAVKVDNTGKVIASNPKTYAPKTPAATSAKGTMGNATFVESSLTKQKLPYAKALASVPAGQIGVIDNATGQFGFINPKDYTAKKYTKI